jgi:hypothetical protein
VALCGRTNKPTTGHYGSIFGYRIAKIIEALRGFVRVSNQMLAGGEENGKIKPEKNQRATRPGG